MAVLVALMIGLWLQLQFLAPMPGTTYRKFWLQGQLDAAMVLNVLILLRVGAARVFQEKNSGWKFYVVLCILSPLLIRFIFDLVEKYGMGYIR